MRKSAWQSCKKGSGQELLFTAKYIVMGKRPIEACLAPLGVHITQYLTMYPPDFGRIHVTFLLLNGMVFKQAKGTRLKAQGKHSITVNVP
jgi:hypothetical protein